MNGRFFAGRTIKAYPMNSKHKFSKTGKGDGGEIGFDATTTTTTSTTTTSSTSDRDNKTEEEKEKERLKAYAEWLEKGGE